MKKTILYTVLTLLFVGLLAWNISFGDVVSSIKAIGMYTIILLMGLYFLVYFTRSAAMSVLLQGEVPFWRLLNAHLIHNFYLHMIPASLGELSLPIMLEKYVPKSRSLSVLLVTRLFNLAVTMLFFAVSVLVIFRGKFKLDLNTNRMIIAVIIILATLAVLLAFSKSKWARDVRIQKIIGKLKTLGSNLVRVFGEDLSFTRVLVMLALTVAYLFFLALSSQIMLSRMGLQLSILQLFFIMSIQAALLVLPIKTFGGFGTTEGSWLLSMMALGIDRGFALSSGFTIHILTLFSAFVFFLVGLAVKFISDRQQVEFIKTDEKR